MLASAQLVCKLACKERRAHFVMPVVIAGIAILYGLAKPTNQMQTSPQFLINFADNCLFRRFKGERASARQEMLIMRLDHSNLVAPDDHDVCCASLCALDIEFGRTKDQGLCHDCSFTYLTMWPGYLMTPRSDASMKRISSSTSIESFISWRMRSRACVVLSRDERSR